MNRKTVVGLDVITLCTLGIIFFDAGVLIALSSLVLIAGAWLVVMGYRDTRPE